MVTIVLGVGVTRGWRATLTGALAGFVVLAVIVAVLGTALTLVPIGPLRLVVGALLLAFGLPWFRKGCRRVAANGLAGYHHDDEDLDEPPAEGFDWTAFTVAFKGVLLEGLEVAVIVVSFGASAGNVPTAIVGGVAAVVIFLGAGAAAHRVVGRIPRSLLQLVVGILLTTFGTFWSAEGLGVQWPLGDAAILWLLVLN